MTQSSIRQTEPPDNGNDTEEVVFIVRVRQQEGPENAGIRGRAEHLRSRTSCYFKDCYALCEFIQSNVHDDFAR